MQNLSVTWTQFKTLVAAKKVSIQMLESDLKYDLFFDEGFTKYSCTIYKITTDVSGIDDAQNTTDKSDFENNYKIDTNKSLQPVDDDGKPFARAESRPLDMATYFTMAGDGDNIGNGKELFWNFATSDDEVTAPSGFKRKRIEFSFIDPIRLKEGTIYWNDTSFGSYIDLYVVCPAGYWYPKNDGSFAPASVDTPIEHFVNKHRMFGDCPMGDELNTEAASLEIPPVYKFWIEVTVPDTDISSHGNISVEIYRRRTVIL